MIFTFHDRITLILAYSRTPKAVVRVNESLHSDTFLMHASLDRLFLVLGLHRLCDLHEDSKSPCLGSKIVVLRSYEAKDPSSGQPDQNVETAAQDSVKARYVLCPPKVIVLPTI